MALSLKDKETDRLAREVAALTGETLTDAIRIAERLERERLRRGQSARLADRLMEIGRHVALNVVDTSALVAILLGEPDADVFARTLAEAPVPLLSAVSRVELSFVIEDRKGETGRADVELLLHDGGFDIVSVTPQQAEIAVDAFRRFGRGRHPARLNIGDCFAYALAIATDHSLLFKGDDFIHTDIRSALPPRLAAR